MKWLVLFLTVLLSQIGFAQRWQPVTYKEGGLTFQVPNKPQTTNRTDQQGNVSVPSKMWISNTPNANYVVSISTIPKSVSSSFVPEMIEGIKKGFLDSTNGNVTSDKQATYAGVSGRQISFKTSNGAYGALWIIRRSNRVITMTVAKNATNYEAEKAKFFGSLKITG